LSAVAKVSNRSHAFLKDETIPLDDGANHSDTTN